jgi:hypothetical protein
MTEYVPDPAARVCAVCGRVADQNEEGGYLHIADLLSGEADHPVVPVLPGEVHTNGKCDFCYGDNPTFIVPVRTFEFDGVPRIELPEVTIKGMGSIGDWAACEPCAKLIERNAWSALLRRLQENDPRAAIPEVATSTRRRWRKVRANITGSVRPFTWPTPPSTGGPA